MAAWSSALGVMEWMYDAERVRGGRDDLQRRFGNAIPI
jgi:hypothetical protein